MLDQALCWTFQFQDSSVVGPFGLFGAKNNNENHRGLPNSQGVWELVIDSKTTGFPVFLCNHAPISAGQDRIVSGQAAKV